jgi:diguanylate cyclase (GGDEF)-like protein
MENPKPSDDGPDSSSHERDQTLQDPLTTSPAEISQLRRQLAATKDCEQDARRALSLLVSIIDRLPVGMTVQSEDGKTLFANETAAEFSGAGVLPNDGAPATAPATDESRIAGSGPAMGSCLTVTTTEDRVVGPGGARTLLKCFRPARILDRTLQLSAAVDFTERKHAEIELSKRAYLDELTELPNRTLIQEHVEHLLMNEKSPSRFALAFLDVDNFKHINDYYTHAIGDALLVKVAQRIAAHIRPSDILGRISGDEFLLVLNPLDNDDDFAELVRNLLKRLKEPFLIEGFEIFTSASIGLSVYPDHGLSYEMLRRAADTAMYRIKEGAKGGAALFNSDMGRAMTVRMAQEQRLRLAVRDGRFCCAFQPKVDIRTHEIVGIEALIRLRDEDGEIQAPSEFIGLATELGLIDDLTYLALRQIIRSMDLLDDAFGPETPVSINIAAKQAGDFTFMRALCDELQTTNYASRFMIEVTEDAFLAKGVFQTQVLPMLREIGTRVSIDDFGTGYSSLAALADITADEIKIDRSFITDIHKRSRSQSILKAIEALSEPLGMTVVAEGVETAEEAVFLQAATRIRFAQGYYFSKPVLMEDLTPTGRGVGNSRTRLMPRERSPSRARR